MSRHDMRDVDLETFVTVWNQQLGLKTPDLHSEIAEWLDWNRGRKVGCQLLMAFRSSGKSTLAGLYAAWLLYRDPDLRILVLAADSILARKMVRQVRKIIEKHPLTPHLVPEKPEQWAGNRFTVNRYTPLRDPSMLARGITSNITGSRADIIICDDVEVPNTCDTAEKRGQLRERLAEIDYVLTPGGTQLYLGTPHTYYSIYADKPRAEIGEDREFLHGFRRLEIPVMDANGDSAWPERYTPYELDQVKRRTGPNKFASQMMLKPVSIAESRLDPSLLNIYGDKLDYTKELNTLFIGGKQIEGASAFWDPAFGSGQGDRSVFAVTFADALGNLYLHRLVYMARNENDTGDEATRQCRIVAATAKENYLPSLCVETNGLGKFLPGLLRNELAGAKTPCAVKEISSTRPKDIRILEAFDAVLAARRLYIHESVLKTPFIMEMQEWRPGNFRAHDDGLDAVAGAIAQQPVRLPRLQSKGRQGWMKGARTHKARNDFEIWE